MSHVRTARMAIRATSLVTRVIELPIARFTLLFNATCLYRPYGHPYRFVGHPRRLTCQPRGSTACSMQHVRTARMAIRTASLATRVA